MSWQFYLEPLLIILGQLFYDIEDAHTNRCLEWAFDHPGEEEEFDRRMGWGVLPRKKSVDFWEEALDYSNKKYAEKNHTRRDVVLWYWMTQYWGLIIKTRWSDRRR